MARARRLLIWLGFFGIVCRALVPAGFMPAPLAAGGPIMFCHGGPAGELVRFLAERHAPAESHSAHAHDAHAHAEHHTSGGAVDDPAAAEHAGWEHCPIGATLAAAAIPPAELTLPLATSAQRLERRGTVAPAGATLVGFYHARAPPAI